MNIANDNQTLESIAETIHQQQQTIADLEEQNHRQKQYHLNPRMLRTLGVILLYLGDDTKSFRSELDQEFSEDIAYDCMLDLFVLKNAPVPPGVRNEIRKAFSDLPVWRMEDLPVRNRMNAMDTKPNPIDAQTARKLLRELADIEEHGRWLDNLSGPRSVFSKKRGYLTGLATLVAMLGLKWMGFSENWFMVVGLPLIVFFIVKKAVYAASKRPTTWRESIDRALTEWVPFDKMAYRSLQQETKELGYMDSWKLRLWVLSEREAIKIAAGYTKGPYEFSLRTTFAESQ